MNLILFLSVPFIALIIMPLVLLVPRVKPKNKILNIICTTLAALCVVVVIGWCLYFYKLIHS